MARRRGWLGWLAQACLQMFKAVSFEGGYHYLYHCIYIYILMMMKTCIYICIQVIDQTIDSIDQTMPPKTCADVVRLGLATVDGRVKYPCISRGLRNPAMNREGMIVFLHFVKVPVVGYVG